MVQVTEGNYRVGAGHGYARFAAYIRWGQDLGGICGSPEANLAPNGKEGPINEVVDLLFWVRDRVKLGKTFFYRGRIHMQPH